MTVYLHTIARADGACRFHLTEADEPPLLVGETIEASKGFPAWPEALAFHAGLRERLTDERDRPGWYRRGPVMQAVLAELQGQAVEEAARRFDAQERSMDD